MGGRCARHGGVIGKPRRIGAVMGKRRKGGGIDCRAREIRNRFRGTAGQQRPWRKTGCAGGFFRRPARGLATWAALLLQLRPCCASLSPKQRVSFAEVEKGFRGERFATRGVWLCAREVFVCIACRAAQTDFRGERVIL